MNEPYFNKISMAEYTAIAAVNHSRLKRMAESPWHYQNPPREKKPSAELTFGTWFHTLLLEPDAFYAHYLEGPVINKNNGEWKKRVAEAEVNGQEVIDGNDWLRLHHMREAVRNDPYAWPLFESGQAEQVLLFNDPVTNLACKARVDWIPGSFQNVLVDLKTTRSGNPNSIRKSCWDYSYHTQSAFYSLAWEVITGHPVEGFLFVFVEKPDDPEDTPLPPQLYQLEPSLMDEGKRLIRSWLNDLDRCIQSYGDQPWPNYTNGLTTLSAPVWAKLGDQHA